MSETNRMHPLLRSIPYFLFFVFYWVAEALFVPYLGLYFELRGMNSVQIGMLNSLFYVVTIVSAMTIGYVADKTRRPRLTVSICFSCVVLVVLYMSRAATLPHLAAAYALYGYFVVSCCDLVDKLLLEQLEGDTRCFGLFRVGSPLGYSGGAILAGVLIPRLGTTSLFPVCMLFAALCVAMSLLMKESSGIPRHKKAGVPVKQLFTSWQSAYIYGTMVLWGFSEAGALSYLAVYMSDRGFSTEYTSVLITIAMVGQTAAFSLMPAIQPVPVSYTHLDVYKRQKPFLYRLAGYAHGGQIQRGLYVGVVHRFQQPRQFGQLDDHARFFRPHRLNGKRDAAVRRNGGQCAQHTGGALKHALGILVPVTAAAVGEHYFGTYLACGPDAVRIIAKRPPAGVPVMRAEKVVVHGAFRREHADVQPVRLYFLFQLGRALVAVVVQQKMRPAAPHLNGFEPQLLLALQKIIEGMVHVMNSHSGKLLAPQMWHGYSSFTDEKNKNKYDTRAARAKHKRAVRRARRGGAGGKPGPAQLCAEQGQNM